MDELDHEVAARIAGQLAVRTGRRGGWFEVRTLMAEFGIERLSPSARERLATALSNAGLRVEPGLDEVGRRDTVVLSWSEAANRPSGTGDPERSRALADVLTTRVAEPEGAVRTVELGSLPTTGPGGIRWFSIADTAGLRAAELYEVLNPHCGGELSVEMVDDLLSPDPRPKVQPWSDRIRGVAAFRASAVESDEGADGSSSKAGVLVFEPVEFLCGGDWLISCWHDAEVFRGAERVGERRPRASNAFFAEIERCWSTGSMSTAGDLGVLVLHELALTYAPAYRQLSAWEDEWELDFFRRPDRIDRDTLLDIRAGAAIMRDWLSPLNPSGLRGDVARAWFPGVSGTTTAGGYERALRVDDRVDRALAGLREFSQTLRSAYDLLALREADDERQRDERFQRNIAVGGSAILIPTLVAGIMGANTWVPGEAGPRSSHWAFAVLLVIVVASGAAAWFVLHKLRERDRARDGRTART